MKYVERQPLADPDAAARKIVEIANGAEAVQDGRIFSSGSMSRSWRPAAVASSSAPGSIVPLRSAGSGGTRAAPT
jgi:hypothetical protein